MRSRPAKLLLLALLLSPTLQAAEVYLKNGDKLSGRILRRESSQVVLSHPVLGEVKIPAPDIAWTSEDAAKAGITTNLGLTPSWGEAQAPVAAPSVAKKPQNDDEDDDEPKSHTWLKGWKRVIADTKGNVEFGYTSQDGRKNQTDLYLRANAEYTNLPNNYRFDWRYYYGDYNDVVQTDKKDWTFRWRRDLNKRWFTQTLTTYSTDKIKNIDMNLEQSAGVGYAALNTNRQKFNLGAGIVGQHRIILAHDTGIIALGEFFEDYTRKINKRINIRQEALVQYSPIHRASYTMLNGSLVESSGDADNYRYSFKAAIQGKLTEQLSINLRFEYEFDNTVIEDELKSDRRISTTIGYSF